MTSQAKQTPTAAAVVAAVSKADAAQAAPVAPAAAARFEHPDAFAVYVFTPNDGYESDYVRRELADEFDYLEKPPTLQKELPLELLYPGVVLYVAHRCVSRERDAETRKFKSSEKLHVSGPIQLKDYFGLSKRHGGLDIDALANRITKELVQDPKGLFWLVRRTNDGGLKLFQT